MSEYIDYLKDVFSRFGPIQAKRMFGGYGVYHDNLMFALVVDGVLYLKANEKTSTRFIELGLAPFEYKKGGRKIKVQYYTAPEEIFEDAELAREWAILAFEAALGSGKRKSKPGQDNTR